MFDQNIDFSSLTGIAQKNALLEAGAGNVEMEVSLVLNGELINEELTAREAAEEMGGGYCVVNRTEKAINAMTEAGSLQIGDYTIVWDGDYTYSEGDNFNDHIGHYW